VTGAAKILYAKAVIETSCATKISFVDSSTAFKTYQVPGECFLKVAQT